MDTGYDSDFQKLKAVAMHEPGNEINSIDNPKKWLFLEKPSLKKMQQEYETVIGLLKAESVKVMELKESFEDTPNLLFTRDLGVFLKNGFYQCCLKENVRKKERILIGNFVKKHHIPLYGKENNFFIEGGDIAFFDKKRVVIGESLRTTKEGIEHFKKYVKKEIVKIPVPKTFIHLDLIFTVLSKKVCLIAPKTLPQSFLDMLRQEDYLIIEAEKTEVGKTAVNVFSLNEKKILAYEGNKKTNMLLSDHGFDVIPVDVAEILKGGGGIRCITLPILRG